MKENLLEEILSSQNMRRALDRVKRNRGSHGVDGMSVYELTDYLKTSWPFLKADLLNGEYSPKPVRRKDIPKPGGGVRMLGIPTVLDRLIQQAILQVLTPIFELGFSKWSFGFRPKRSAHMALKSVSSKVQQGYKWVVDMDLEKFFDRVNHDILMSRVARKVKDKRVLRLIRKYLQSGILVNGIAITVEEGTPQGGPLSPLLANILLDDLDKELEKRGHEFCRYADDFCILVKSQRAGERVKESLKVFLERKLKLKINESKSSIVKITALRFLGYGFYWKNGQLSYRVHPDSLKKFKSKLKIVTNRNLSISFDERLYKLKKSCVGWINYFRLADMKSLLQRLDEWIRRRLRACLWKQWKKTKTKANMLMKLGVSEAKAWQWANTRKKYWRVAGSHILCTTVTNKLLERRGYLSMKAYYKLHCN